MMCMTELHGGVCHSTSIPHKSGNKMKEKKKVTYVIRVIRYRRGKGTRCVYVLAFYHSIVS